MRYPSFKQRVFALTALEYSSPYGDQKCSNGPEVVFTERGRGRRGGEGCWSRQIRPLKETVIIASGERVVQCVG